jgi:hypothetical protein
MLEPGQRAERQGAATAAQGMPARLRLPLLAMLAAVLAGAAYLLWVRGEALVLDLAAFSQRIFCF